MVYSHQFDEVVTGSAQVHDLRARNALKNNEEKRKVF
jgi:hypothetical protein